MSEPTDKTLRLHPLDRPLRGDELKAVAEEIKQDEQAARERDSGGEERVREPSYDQRLEDAAEAGKHRSKSRSKGPDL